MTVRSRVVVEDGIRSQIGSGDCMRGDKEMELAVMNDAFNTIVCEEESHLYF